MNLEKTYTEYLIETITLNTLIKRVNQLSKLKEIDENLRGDLIPIIRLNTNSDEKFQVPQLLDAVIKKHFSKFDVKKEYYAQSILKEKCNALLEERITPFEFSKIIPELEILFDYPEWLGDLYNVFDWCDENTETNHYIKEEIIERIKDLERIMKKNNNDQTNCNL